MGTDEQMTAATVAHLSASEPRSSSIPNKTVDAAAVTSMNSLKQGASRTSALINKHQLIKKLAKTL